MQRRGAKSFVDDLVLSRGVVLSRAAASLRSIETKPFDWKICPLWTDIHLPTAENGQGVCVGPLHARWRAAVARASEPCTSRTSVPSRDRRAGKCFLFSKSNLAVARKNSPPSGRMPATAAAGRQLSRVPGSLPQQHPYSVRRRQANRHTHGQRASQSGRVAVAL